MTGAGSRWFAASLALLGAVIGGLFFLLSSATTPSHVYQITEKIRIGLKDIQKLRGISAHIHGYKPFNREPRHVMQKARDLTSRFNTLLQQTKLTFDVLPIFPVRKVTPKDVSIQVQQLWEGVVRLREHNSLPQNLSEEVPLVRGKNATDIYANLEDIEDMLESLGAPKIVAEDVFRLATTIRDDISFIMQTAFHTCEQSSQQPSRGKTAADVYYLAFHNLGNLHELTRRKFGDYAPVNLQVPQLKRKPVSSKNVFDFLDLMLADVGALKHALNIQKQSKIDRLYAYKSASDIFDIMITISNQLNCVLGLENKTDDKDHHSG